MKKFRLLLLLVFGFFIQGYSQNQMLPPLNYKAGLPRNLGPLQGKRGTQHQLQACLKRKNNCY